MTGSEDHKPYSEDSDGITKKGNDDLATELLPPGVHCIRENAIRTSEQGTLRRLEADIN